ncbi:hypothetical protein FIBSPDRAFT_870414 [Athelia psychrophila]|uniref:Uncharacterized protein n=1 Tax=Athelia psychrophila TaxID=1759441 RepID=A0A166B3D5_9AGAM|nr:hypothetical protein FIBSPDRAFT_870414 [Fibularhizoctonia sp. CBS 109695]
MPSVIHPIASPLPNFDSSARATRTRPRPSPRPSTAPLTGSPRPACSCSSRWPSSQVSFTECSPPLALIVAALILPAEPLRVGRNRRPCEQPWVERKLNSATPKLARETDQHTALLQLPPHILPPLQLFGHSAEAAHFSSSPDAVSAAV